ncbi:MAG: hypothetical protein NZ518_11960, partial [Dehalococcoidia bacterium]|nr:hypothetical protein [Dehalococcoidia bacterium]
RPADAAGGRGVAIRLRDAERPGEDLAAWIIQPFDRAGRQFLDFSPIPNSVGRTYLILLEPMPGVGPLGVTSLAAGTVDLSLAGEPQPIGLAVRRVYQAPPLVWLIVHGHRVASGALGPPWLAPAVILAFVGVVGVAGAAVLAITRAAGPVRAAVGAVALGAAFGALQTVGAQQQTATLVGSPPDAQGRIVADFTRVVRAPTTVVRGEDASTQNRVVRSVWARIGGEPLPAIYAHPPAELDFPVTVPERAVLRFSLGMDPEVWRPDRGDGVEFVVLVTDRGRSNVVMRDQINPKSNPADRRWHDREVSLAPWAGQEVVLTFRTVGLQNDAFDFALWGRPRIVQR